jgi:aconitate hydratase
MGVLPLTFKDGQDANILGLDGTEFFDIPISSKLEPLSWITISARKMDGTNIDFEAKVRLDTPVEAEYFRNGGILQTVLRNLVKEK